MTTAKRPDLPEFLALAFSPEAASALTDTNALARQLRDMPANLLTDQIRNDRDRVLGEHLGVTTRKCILRTLRENLS